VRDASGKGLIDHLSANVLETGTCPETLLGEIKLDREEGKVIDRCGQRCLGIVVATE
jgi:hypothetical protein